MCSISIVFASKRFPVLLNLVENNFPVLLLIAKKAKIGMMKSKIGENYSRKIYWCSLRLFRTSNHRCSKTAVIIFKQQLLNYVYDKQFITMRKVITAIHIHTTPHINVMLSLLQNTS